MTPLHSCPEVKVNFTRDRWTFAPLELKNQWAHNIKMFAHRGGLEPGTDNTS